MNTQLLLQEISAISKKYDLINQKTGGCFNIFEISNVATDEVTICRVLFELLSPNGSHYQGNSYLKVFIEDILHIDMTDMEISTARVFREYVIDENRRIDLVIETSERFIPIEVKIYARDQPKQCFDYFQKARNSAVYYLTRYGGSPGDNSANGLTKTAEGYKKIICISFADDILNWMDKCIKQTATLKIAPIREVILQFMSVIRQFTNQMEDDKEMEIKEVLMKSSDNMRSAIAIQNSIDEAKETLIIKLFEEIEKKVDAEKIINEYDYEFDEYKKIHGFYKYNNSTYPGISYHYKGGVKPDTDIWLRIEIDWKIFVGYCCPIKQKLGKQPLSDIEIKSVLKVEPCVAGWWAYWEYLPDNNKDESPDFKHTNEPFMKLFDEATFNTFVNICAKKIIELLNR